MILVLFRNECNRDVTLPLVDVSDLPAIRLTPLRTLILIRLFLLQIFLAPDYQKSAY